MVYLFKFLVSFGGQVVKNTKIDISIYDYDDYKLYLNETITSMPSKGRGLRLALAKFLNCQTAYISQVLNQYSHFSLEQAVRVSQFFEHNKEESKFFLLMVQYARAGSVELQEFLKSSLDEILEKRKNLKNRLGIDDSLDERNQHIYYSAWYYAAIHIILSIPGFQTARSIADHLRLPLELVQDVLSFLCETGLATQDGKSFKIGKTKIFIEKDSVQIKRHHNNWRNQAMASIDRKQDKDYHYSSVLSMGEKDIPKVKEIMVKCLEDCRQIIKDSPEEQLQVITMDFFELK